MRNNYLHNDKKREMNSTWIYFDRVKPKSNIKRKFWAQVGYVIA